MARRYRARRARKYELLNYNFQKAMTVALNTYAYITHSVNATQRSYLTVVPAGTYAGVRKVKNFVISIVAAPQHEESNVLLRWCLVYLPQRTSSGDETLNTTDGTSSAADMVQIYEPNQNIIATGTAVGEQGTRVRTSLARNLMNGDQIILFIQYILVTGNLPEGVTSATVNFNVNVQYALCYN